MLEEMLKNNAIAGGEQSGHLIFLEYNTTGDGILTALLLLKLMNDSDSTIEELLKDFRKYPQVLHNAKVSNKSGWDKNDRICQVILKYEELLGSEGRILVRASGTENLIRVMVEGKDYEQINGIALDIKNTVLGELS